MKVYAYDIEFNVKNKQGTLLNNQSVILKLQKNTGFFLEDDSEGLLNGTPTQSKSFVSSSIGRVTARVYFKTPEKISIFEENVSGDVISITPASDLTENLLSLDFKDAIPLNSTVDFNIKCTDPDTNGISETIDILVNDTYYDSIQTNSLGYAVYNYNNTSTSGTQTIKIECINATPQTKELVIQDGS